MSTRRSIEVVVTSETLFQNFGSLSDLEIGDDVKAKGAPPGNSCSRRPRSSSSPVAAVAAVAAAAVVAAAATEWTSNPRVCSPASCLPIDSP